MMFLQSLQAIVLLSFSLISQAISSTDTPPHLRGKRSNHDRDGVTHTVFEHDATGGRLEFVTNSGICETTYGVNQYSGYLSVGPNQNMWFWFFEARNAPSTAPLATWFNGGPGCSSMIGLFQENGPCHFISNSTTPSLNPYSWNTHVNMLYIDQPIGVGFSYGNDPVTSTVTAAPYVWILLQAFFAAFPQYENRDFGLWTESYGGHYGPEFAEYFEEMNRGIGNGTVYGQKVDLVALGINNGWFDPVLQYKAYVDFSYNNTYRPLINAEQHRYLNEVYNSQCLPLLQKCTTITGRNSQCQRADYTCLSDIQDYITAQNGLNLDVYDIRKPPISVPETYYDYLHDPVVIKAIGAKHGYDECADDPYDKFAATGDDSRSFLPTLSTLVQAGLRTLIWAGDADWICNWFGGLAVADAIQYDNHAAFRTTPIEQYRVNGSVRGEFKSAGNLTWLRVYAAGHEVPFYQPELALQVFNQVMMGETISST